jgi:hypothetical protein
MLLESARSIVEIHGNPVIYSYGVACRGMGKTSLTLQPKSLIEQTQNRVLGVWFGSRHCEIPVARIDSCEILEQGNSLFLGLAIVLALPTFGIGALLCLVLYFLLKQRYLVVRSSTNVVGVALAGNMDMERARMFMAEFSRLTDGQMPHAQTADARITESDASRSRGLFSEELRSHGFGER